MMMLYSRFYRIFNIMCCNWEERSFIIDRFGFILWFRFEEKIWCWFKWIKRSDENYIIYME